MKRVPVPAATAVRPLLVMLHGWGLHRGCWDGIAARLRDDYDVVALDLPGHGRRLDSPDPYSLDALAADLVDRVSGPAVWLGWSLGAMVAMALALRTPQLVNALVLVGATPRFVAGSGWSAGLAAAEVEGFAASLVNDYDATLHRFLSLQVTRDEPGRATLRTLRAQLQQRPPRVEALHGGLGILRFCDLRADAARISVPTLLLHGDRDRLVPPAASIHLQQSIAGARREVIAGAGHAPMLSHPQQFEIVLRRFLAPGTAVEATR